MEWKLEARAISRRSADGSWLVREASLIVDPGARIALRGESGSGKTVLLRALAALDPLQGGALVWSGEEQHGSALPRYRSRAPYLHQRPVLVEGSVEDNLALPFTLAIHAGKALDRERAVALLDALGKPASFLAKSHADLSGGEAQIAALARTLLADPALLLLDEPTASLDAKSAALVERTLRAWLDEAPGRRALVCASHDPSFVEALTTRRLDVHGGVLTGAVVNPSYVTLGYGDLALAASLVLVNGALSLALQLRLERQLLWASARMTVQLMLIGFVLKAVFASGHPWLVVVVLVPMTLIAGISAVRRAERTFPGMMLDSIVSIAASAWLITGFALVIILRSDPWYAPQHAIPLAGLVLGNSLTGIALAIDRLGADLVARRAEVEMLLSLGATRWEAARDSVRRSLRAGLLPMINTMLVAGIVSLPGMMTGQLLAGASPAQAARYQIVVMFLLAASTALGSMGAVLLGYRRLFNDQHQFRHDLLSAARKR